MKSTLTDMDKKTAFESLAAERYSCRKYLPDMPDTDAVGRIIEAGRLAPSACNRQPWRFVLVRSEAALAAVRSAYDRAWIATAPMFIVVCGVPAEAWVRSFDGLSHMAVDAAIATEHLCLAATAEGLATCWVCNFDPEALKSSLSLPEDLEPVAILPLGYPADSAPAKNRRSADELIIEL